MDILSQLALPTLGYKTIDELSYHMHTYEELSKSNDMRINKETRKKLVLLNTFDLLSGIFDLDFDQRLVFYKSDSYAICLDNIDDKTYSELFHELFNKCFIKYIEKIHTLKDNRISEETYTIIKLALLNHDNRVINCFADRAYSELLENMPWLKLRTLDYNVSMEDVAKLVEQNKIRNRNIKESVKKYKAYQDLSSGSIREVFKCFSIDIFQYLDKEEKAHIMNILYNYFSLEDKMDKYPKYKKMINNSSTNKECLECLIEDLKLPGRTMIIMKKNKDIIKDVLSWTSIVYANETKKENIHSLDGLTELLKQNKKL